MTQGSAVASRLRRGDNATALHPFSHPLRETVASWCVEKELSMRLAGKVAAVTGAAQGLGRACA